MKINKYSPLNKEIIYTFVKSGEERTSDYQIILGSHVNDNFEVSLSDTIRYLFINMLLNEIGENIIESFLDYHFFKYQFEKDYFLNTLKKDLDEFYIKIEEAENQRKKDISLIVIELMPFFSFFGHNEYLSYKRRFERCNYWIEDKDEKLNTPKEYKSLTRARAFCINEMLTKGKISKEIIGSRNKIVELAENEFHGQSGKTIYDRLCYSKQGIFYHFEEQKVKHQADYKYGLKLFKEKYPD